MRQDNSAQHKATTVALLLLLEYTVVVQYSRSIKDRRRRMAMTRALLISISDRFISKIPAPKKGFAFIPIGLKEKEEKEEKRRGGLGRAGCCSHHIRWCDCKDVRPSLSLSLWVYCRGVLASIFLELFMMDAVATTATAMATLCMIATHLLLFLFFPYYKTRM